LISEDRKLSSLLSRIRQNFEITQINIMSFQGEKLHPSAYCQIAGKTAEITFTLSEVAGTKVVSAEIHAIHILEE
jgi:hypothetical protein